MVKIVVKWWKWIFIFLHINPQSPLQLLQIYSSPFSQGHWRTPVHFLHSARLLMVWRPPSAFTKLHLNYKAWWPTKAGVRGRWLVAVQEVHHSHLPAPFEASQGPRVFAKILSIRSCLRACNEHVNIWPFWKMNPPKSLYAGAEKCSATCSYMRY